MVKAVAATATIGGDGHNGDRRGARDTGLNPVIWFATGVSYAYVSKIRRACGLSNLANGSSHLRYASSIETPDGWLVTTLVPL